MIRIFVNFIISATALVFCRLGWLTLSQEETLIISLALAAIAAIYF